VIRSFRARPLLRRVGAVLIVLVVLAIAAMGYRLAKAYATFYAVGFAVHKTRVDLIDPNEMTVGETFTIGLEPEWLHSQWSERSDAMTFLDGGQPK